MNRSRNDIELDRLAELTRVSGVGPVDALDYVGQDRNSNPQRHALYCAVADAARAARKATDVQWAAIINALRAKLQPGQA